MVLENIFTEAQMQAWKDGYEGMVSRQLTFGGVKGWLRHLTEAEPRLMLPAVANPNILDFAEKVMGPFVQLDNLTFMGFPSVSKEEAEGKASGWHRDRYGWLPEGPQYIKPPACNAIAYMQDLTDEYGPLRVVPGSHRSNVVPSDDDRQKPHTDEKIIHVKAGDVVFTHCCVLHSGTPNYSGKLRYFFSIYYNLSYMKTTDNHNGPNITAIIGNAEKRDDRRTKRLFGVDNQVEMRVNSGFAKHDEVIWEEWIEEDRVVLKEPLDLDELIPGAS